MNKGESAASMRQIDWQLEGAIGMHPVGLVAIFAHRDSAEAKTSKKDGAGIDIAQ